jgi:hypothetical protein
VRDGSVCVFWCVIARPVCVIVQEMKGKRVSDVPFVPVSVPVVFEDVERARSREAMQRGMRVMGTTGGGSRK